MSKTHVVTARLDGETMEGLARLAEQQDRPRARLIEEAVGRYVAEEARLDAFLKEGEDAIARGDYITHEQLVAEIAAMGSRSGAA